MNGVAVLGASTVLVLVSACGRSGLASRDAARRDGPSPSETDVPGVAPPDGVRERPSDPPGTPSDARAGNTSASDAGADAPTRPDLLPASCPRLANGGVLNLGRAKQALFAADGSSVLLRIGAADSDAADAAVLLPLGDGDLRVLGSGLRSVEWLGQGAALLTAADQSKLAAVSLAGEVLLTVPMQTCSHAAAPDGARIYYTHSGCDSGAGALSVVSVADGTTRQLTDRAATGSVTVSPDGKLAAYLAYVDPRDTPPRTSAVFVTDASLSSYNVLGPTSAWGPTFASEGILLFQSVGADAGASTIWRHDIGTGSGSRALTEGDVGITGFQFADAASGLPSGFLMARFPGYGSHGDLYLAPIDGGNPVRLASDLMDYRMYSMPRRSNAFAPKSQRVLYIADTPSDASQDDAIVSLSADGHDRIQLGGGHARVMISPYADRVALADIDDTLGRGTLSVVSATGSGRLSVEVTGNPRFAAFVPRDRGLLFIEEPGSSDRRLRHLSFASGNVTTLGTWTTSRLAFSSLPAGVTFGGYPVDPSGCFTVVDSDLDQTGGRLGAIPD